MECLVGFPVIQKHLTLYDFEWLFYVHFYLRTCSSRTLLHVFRKQSRKQTKTNTDRHTLSAANMTEMRI